MKITFYIRVWWDHSCTYQLPKTRTFHMQ
ncbi:hypothetical protein PR048_016698 [Dryococelus australis]|uniref:Uncharacterized protein n=1 Tax=Dryococelus australis TaxID=614101 RepID=A0ABQ9H7F5_9NEOP|nr:hypothetical protein PR048_016698 [Dryococelus australis]